jgi:uncharacterized protein YutE (UPF0331/DUF86 family)
MSPDDQKVLRLETIAQRIGFTLWQLQELEGVAATYLVLKTQAKPGMGLAEGTALVEKAQSGTFGTIVKKLLSASAIPAELEQHLRNLLRERNWLVHESRRDSRSAVHDDFAMHVLIERVDAMANEAEHFLHIIAKLAEAHIKVAGVTEEQIEAQAKRILKQWHSGN